MICLPAARKSFFTIDRVARIKFTVAPSINRMERKTAFYDLVSFVETQKRVFRGSNASSRLLLSLDFSP